MFGRAKGITNHCKQITQRDSESKNKPTKKEKKQETSIILNKKHTHFKKKRYINKMKTVKENKKEILVNTKAQKGKTKKQH